MKDFQPNNFCYVVLNLIVGFIVKIRVKNLDFVKVGIVNVKTNGRVRKIHYKK